MKYLQFKQPGLGVDLLGHELNAPLVGPRSSNCLKEQSRFRTGQDHCALDVASPLQKLTLLEGVICHIGFCFSCNIWWLRVQDISLFVWPGWKETDSRWGQKCLACFHPGFGYLLIQLRSQCFFQPKHRLTTCLIRMLQNCFQRPGYQETRSVLPGACPWSPLPMIW